MECLAVLLALIAGLLGIYYYCFRNVNYFKGTGLPHVSPLPLFGNMAPAIFRRATLADIISRTYNLNRDAKYVGFFDLMTPAVIIRDLELIKTLGVKNFDNLPNHRGFIDNTSDPLFGNNLFSLRDDRWREVRALLSPSFTSSKMKNMFHLMFECANNFTEFLAMLPPEKRVMEMKDATTKYTTDVIATCAFGISIDSMKNPDNEFYVLGKEMTNFHGLRSLKFVLFRILPKLARLMGLKIVSDRVGKFFKDIVSSSIRVRDEQGINRPDMIQLMMETRGKGGAGKGLTFEDMTAQALVFFFGGFDTTSTHLGFVLHEIAVNPNIQARLQSEIDTVLKNNNGEVNYEILNGMEYLDAVISEALRLYPVFLFTDRISSTTFELPPALPDGKHFVVKKGMSVLFPIYGLHHDPDYFENPKKFDPERFLGENKKNVNHAAYMPFGIGPRMCIGNRFALLETKVLIFQLLARCNLRPCAKTSVPIKLTKKAIVMFPENGFWLEVQPRDDAVLRVIANDAAARSSDTVES